MTHPAVVECAITGVPDDIRGQVVKATIVLSKEYENRAGDELVKEIQNHVKARHRPIQISPCGGIREGTAQDHLRKIRRVEIRRDDSNKND